MSRSHRHSAARDRKKSYKPKAPEKAKSNDPIVQRMVKLWDVAGIFPVRRGDQRKMRALLKVKLRKSRRMKEKETALDE